ncbi:tail fiber protein [Salmonella enterica]
MHRIDTPTAQKDKFGQGKNGFTNGDPATGRRATDLNSDMWDAVQEEVCTVIEAAGIPLSKGEHTQLHAAIGRLIDEQVKTRLEKNQNGADIPNPALFRQNIGVYDASTSQKGLVRLNGGVTDESNETAATSGAVKVAYDAAIAAADIAKTKWSAVDATISQKGIVMLSDNTGVPDSTTAATTTAVNYVLNQAAAAYSLAESKYTAGGATTGKAGLVQLVNSMGGSGSLVMPQAAVTTAIQNYPSLGKGQTLQDLRGTRSIDATYTNSTGFPIAVYVRIAGGTSANLYVHVNGIEFGGGGSIASNTSIATAFFIVPNGATYRVMASGSSIALQAWSELR